MKAKSVLELTPLLDILLIILFGFMIHTKQLEEERQESLSLTKAEVVWLQEALEASQQELESYRNNLSASELTISDYERQVAHQQKVLAQTIAAISKKMGEFFELQTLEMQQKMETGELAVDDYQHYLEQVEALNLNNLRHMVEKVYILGELQEVASIVNVYLDDNNRVYLEGKALEIMLGGFDESLGDFPKETKVAFSEALKDTLLAFYENRKTGEQPLSEVILITFGHSDKAMRGAIQLGKEQTRLFYRDVDLREAGSRKVFFSDLGYYPFKP